MNYLLANWKSHKSVAEMHAWFEQMKGMKLDDGTNTVVVCPPAVYLLDAYDLIERLKLPMKLGMQDVSSFPLGAYTGAIAAEMVHEWVDFAIVGHSERRRYFHETSQEVANKVRECLEVKIRPVVCVDEPYMKEQIDMLSKAERKKIILAYEPLTAIGSGYPDSPEHAAEVAAELKQLTDNAVPVIYGGSVTSENLGYYLLKDEITGALVGNASLDAAEWLKMVKMME